MVFSVGTGSLEGRVASRNAFELDGTDLLPITDLQGFNDELHVGHSKLQPDITAAGCYFKSMT